MSDSKETVVRIRPIKLIAVVFSIVTLILLLSSIAGKEWVEVKFLHGNKQVITWGLWDICNGDVCEPGTTDWVRVCATFSIIALLLCLTVVLCGILGLLSQSLPKRRLFYLIAGIVISLVALADLLSLIIYPVKFRETVSTFINVKRWDFDWTYGFGWGAFIFAVAAAVFFFLPIENQELQSKPY